MDYHPIQGGVAILLGILYAREIGINSGPLGFWLLCAFILLILKLPEWPEWLASKGERLEGRKKKGEGIGERRKEAPSS